MLNQFWVRRLLANLKLVTASSPYGMYAIQQHVQEQLNAISFSRELIIKANCEDAASYHPWNWRDFQLHYFCSRSRIVRPSLLTNAGNGRQTDSHL